MQQSQLPPRYCYLISTKMARPFLLMEGLQDLDTHTGQSPERGNPGEESGARNQIPNSRSRASPTKHDSLINIEQSQQPR